MKKISFAKIALILAGLIGCYALGWTNSKRVSNKKLPSCIYIGRPSSGSVKPWGYDNKEGVDVGFSRITGGGIYVSLEEFKQ